jgi:hypothetical protein
MKVMLYVVLERGELTRQLVNQILKDGYNGTLIKTKGLKHVNDSHDEPTAYLSLSQIAENTDETNTTMFFILEDEQTKKLQNDIREGTANFKKIHGGMFVVPVNDFEGSF